MNRRTRYNHRDGNEKEIVAALGRMGIAWYEGGPLDGWCAFPDGWVPVEVKTATGRLSKGQQEFIAQCADHNRPVLVLRSADEAIEAVMSRAVKFLKQGAA